MKILMYLMLLFTSNLYSSKQIPHLKTYSFLPTLNTSKIQEWAQNQQRRSSNPTDTNIEKQFLNEFNQSYNPSYKYLTYSLYTISLVAFYITTPHIALGVAALSILGAQESNKAYNNSIKLGAAKAFERTNTTLKIEQVTIASIESRTRKQYKEKRIQEEFIKNPSTKEILNKIVALYEKHKEYNPEIEVRKAPTRNQNGRLNWSSANCYQDYDLGEENNRPTYRPGNGPIIPYFDFSKINNRS